MELVPKLDDFGCRRLWLAPLASWLFAGLLVASANQVTYQVNMGVQRALGNFNPAAGDTVVVSGTFSTTDWTTASTLTQSVSDTNIYSGTFNNNVGAGNTEYHKFIINPGGNSTAGQLNWETNDNRSFLVAAGNQTLPVVYFSNVTNGLTTAVINDAPIDFIAGADISLLKFFEDRSVTYRAGGQVQDALAILKQRGINCIRLRLFTSSAAQAQADPYNFINNLDYTVPLAVRVKNAGLKFMLDFHYSDTWADPAHQTMPAAWTNLNYSQLVQQVRDYSSNCIAVFKAAGAMPDYVQVGNEITGGMLWTLGAVPGSNPATQWSQLAQLLSSAIQGVQDAAGTNMPKTIIHIDRGGDWSTTKWFFDNLIQNQHVQFDIIGESYYSVWHGSLDDLANCLTNAALRYGKPVIVAETAFPWTNSYWTTNIIGLSGTTNGQAQYVVQLTQTVKSVPNQLGAGIVWWGTEYQKVKNVNTAGFNTASFFDAQGNVLPAADLLGQTAAPLLLNASHAGSTLNVHWPLSGAGMALTTTTSVSPDSVWVQVTNPVQFTGSVYRTSVPVRSDGNRFYRLQSN